MRDTRTGRFSASPPPTQRGAARQRETAAQRVGVRESEDMYRCILGKNRQPSSAAAAAVHVADTRRTQVAQTLETRPPRALEMASCSLKKLARLLPKNAPEKTHDDER